MSARLRILLPFLLLTAILLPAAAWAAPTIVNAAADPALVKPGDTVKFTCTITDTENLVARVTGTIREVSYMSAPFTRGEGGVWSFALPVPNGAPAGTYHIDLRLLTADGKIVKPAAGPESIEVKIAGEEAQVEAAPAAPDPAPDLLALEVKGDAGTFMLYSPYRRYSGWYKGQLHCHTVNSDGKCTPAQLEAKYRAIGCAWIAITDHETVTADPRAEGGQDVGAFITALEHGTPEGHANLIGVKAKIGGNCQQAINQTVAQGGLFMLNHPDWVACYDLREMERLSGYQLIEIMNGGCLGDGQQDGTRAWDFILGKGKRVWGVATDDFHGGPDAEVGKGLVVVNAPELTAEAIFASLKNGNFYATQGPQMALSLDDGVLSVTSPGNVSIFFRGPHGLAYQVDEREPGADPARYVFKGDEGYVRVEVYDKETGKRAWSQPIFVEKK